MVKKKKEGSKKNGGSSKSDKIDTSKFPTLKLMTERDIALDFATKVYKEFDQMIKSVVLFGSTAKKTVVDGSDIDIIILIDDVSISWDEELISYYREKLGEIIKENPYKKSLHINSVKLSTWWNDLMRGDPVVINILRHGDTLIDYGGFFDPLKVLLKNGAIRSTPEAIYTLLQRAPTHLARATNSLLAVVDGLYWCCVDSAHAALISSEVMPPSPEHIGDSLDDTFVSNKMLKRKFVDFYNEIHSLTKDIVHGRRVQVSGKKLDELYERTDEFLQEMIRLVDDVIDSSK